MRCRCYCNYDYESMAMIGAALNDVLTERYLIFHKTVESQFLWYRWDKTVTVEVHVPKYNGDGYKEKYMNFMKECISLHDRGYTHGPMTEEFVEKFRARIAEYQMNKNEVWG